MHKAAESNPQPLRRTHAAEDAFNVREADFLANSLFTMWKSFIWHN